MASYNTQTTYNRTYEKKVVEEAPRTVRLGSPFGGSLGGTLGGTTITIPPTSFPSFPTFSPSSGGLTTHQSSSSSRTVGTTSGTLQQTDDSLHVSINLADFKPEELKVSVVGEWIVVDAQHGEKTDDLGIVERHITRKFPLPRGCPPEVVASNLSSDGVLSVSAVAPRRETTSPARSIPIKIVPGGGSAPTSQSQSSSTQQ